MNQDRELLELAAKAVGYEIEEWNAWGFAQTKEQERWNPLVDDGDALRLAVALGLVVDCSRPSAAPPFVRHDYSPSDCRDHAEATRRAIVQAAAEIGRSMA